MTRPQRRGFFRGLRRRRQQVNVVGVRLVTALGVACVVLAYVIGYDLTRPEVGADRLLLPSARGWWIVGIALFVLHAATFGALRVLSHVDAALRRITAVAAVGVLLAACWIGVRDVRNGPGGGSGLRDFRIDPVPGGALLQGTYASAYVEDVYWVLEPAAEHLFRDESAIVARWDRRSRFAPILTPAGRSRALRFPSGRPPARLLVTPRDVVAVRIPCADGLGWGLVWDSRTKASLWDGPRGRLPFLALLGPDDVPDPSDVALLAARAARARRDLAKLPADDRFDLPTEADLIAALDDPRAMVRDAVVAIVKAGGPELYPKATEAVAAKGR